jgi:hypothetical protein
MALREQAKLDFAQHRLWALRGIAFLAGEDSNYNE